MTRDLVVKPLDYSPYISIHWEDAAGGHDFKIDPPLDSPAYVAKFSQKENQFVCGSDFRIDRTQVFGSAGVFIPNKGFRLFFYNEQFLLMGGFIGQPPIMFSAGSRSYEVFKKFPLPEDGSYFTYGRELAVKDANYLALCSSNTPSIVDLYQLDENQSFVKVKSIDTGSTVVRLLPDRKGFYVAFADSYLFVDMSAQQEVIGKPVKALLHAVEYGIFGDDICTLVLSHDKNVYYKNSTSANETLIFALKPNFDFVIQTLKGSNTRGVPNILICVYYRSSTILCEPAYYILDKERVLIIPPSTVTYSTSEKKDVGFTITRDDRAAGPYGLYAKDTYEDLSFNYRGLAGYGKLSDADYNLSWAVELDHAIAHDKYLYTIRRVTGKSTDRIMCGWQSYTRKPSNPYEPLEYGILSCPDYPDGKFPFDTSWFEIRNSTMLSFGKNKDGAQCLFDLKDHSFKCLLNTTTPSNANLNRPDLTVPSGYGNSVYYVYDNISDTIITCTFLQDTKKLIVFKIDFFDKTEDGNFAYSATHFIDTKNKIDTGPYSPYTRVSLEFVKNCGVIVAIYWGTDLNNNVYKCTKTSHELLSLQRPKGMDSSFKLSNFRYLSKSDCFVVGWDYNGGNYVYELAGNSINYIYKLTAFPIYAQGYRADSIIGFEYDGKPINKQWYYSLYFCIGKITKTKFSWTSYKVINQSTENIDAMRCSDSATEYTALFSTRDYSGVSVRYSNYYVYPTSKTLYPCFSPYLPFSAKESEVLDSVSIDDTVNFTNQAEQTGRHLMYKDNSLYEIKRFPAEEYYSADHVFNVSYSPSGKFVIYQNPDGMNLARRKAGGNYVNISKKSLTFVDGYNAGWDSITEKDFETHPLHTKLSNFVFGKSPLLFTYLALPATDTLEAGVPDISNGTSSDEPLSPYGRRIVRTDGKNFYRIYYDWNKNMVRSHAAFDSGEIYMASTYLRSGGAESDIVLYLIAGDKATPPDAHGYSDLNNAFTCDRKPVKFGPIDFSVCDVVVVAHGRDNDQEQPFTFFKLDRKEHTLTDMHLKIDNWDVDAPILDVKFLDCDRIVVVTPDEAILIDDDEDDDEKKKKIKDRVKLKKGGIIKEVDKGKFKVDGDGDGSGMGSGGSGFGVGKDWLKPEYIVEALSINIFYRD